MGDKFFYDISLLNSGKFGLFLFVEVDNELEEFEDVLGFNTYEEAEAYKDELPDFAYHVEQFGDV